MKRLTVFDYPKGVQLSRHFVMLPPHQAKIPLHSISA
jgi:hypothetical protein